MKVNSLTFFQQTKDDIAVTQFVLNRISSKLQATQEDKNHHPTGNTLAQMIIEELWDRKFIDFERCKDICNFLDVEFEKYKKLYPPTPLVELAKDYPYLSKLMESFNKKDN